MAVFLAATFFAGALVAAVFLAATFLAVVFFAGAFEVVVVDAAVFVFLTDACLLERVLVVTGFFAPVGAAFFFAAGLAFADVFWVQAASTPWRRIESKPLVYQIFCRHDRFSFERLSSGVPKIKRRTLTEWKHLAKRNFS